VQIIKNSNSPMKLTAILDPKIPSTLLLGSRAYEFRSPEEGSIEFQQTVDAATKSGAQIEIGWGPDCPNTLGLMLDFWARKMY
jgi:hypothetical protein